MNSHSVLIDELGGAPAVARTLNLKTNVVSNWHKRGRIPWRWRPAIARLAASKEILVAADFLESEAA